MSIGQHFRKTALELREASKIFIEAPDLATDVRKQINVIVAQTVAHQYEALADFADWVKGADGIERMIALRRRFSEQNDRIRKAAARGDWDEFDRIVAGRDSEPGVTEGNGET